VSTVQRVHWLRARAQSGRWNEEVVLVGYEMQWTIRYFFNKADHWENLLAAQKETGHLTLGPAAYAAQKAGMWRWLPLKAKKHFVEVHPNLQLLV
jgi:hypothetical protein